MIARLFAMGAMLSIVPAMANEVMTDRCSGDVSFPPAYDMGPTVIGSLILTRSGGNATNWSYAFRVTTDHDGRIRWWCHSTTGNWFDPGTWRIDSGYVGAKCDSEGNCSPTADLSVKPPDASSGWTAERSRCDSHASVIRARLGPDRLLQIECLAGNVGHSGSALTTRNCASGPDTCTAGFVWREANGADHVCVHPAVRAQAAADNRAAESRRNPGGGASGHDTCRPGFVWREAFPNDHVCVEVAVRSQAAFDNRHKNERRACR